MANVWANARNSGTDPVALLDRMPLDRVAYVHVAGGIERAGLYHDTHRHPVPTDVLDLLSYVADRAPIPGVMLERDGDFAPTVELDDELDAIARAGGCVGEARPLPRPRPASHGVASFQRDRLAGEQAALVNALVELTAPPAGFDPSRFEAVSAALAVKRAETGMRR